MTAYSKGTIDGDTFADVNPTKPVASLVDPFSNTSIDGAMWQTTQTSGTAAEGAGSLTLTPNASTNSSVLVSSKSVYYLTGSQAAVNVTQVPNSGVVDSQFSLLLDGNNYVQWVYQSGSLFANYIKGGVKTTLTTSTYSATRNAWWRIRESGGTVYWETSPEGFIWTSQASIATSNLFVMAGLHVNFYVETYGGGLASPGAVKFDKLNANVNPWADPFNGSTVDTTKWTVNTTAGSITESSGAVNMAPNANSGSTILELKSISTANFSSNSASVKAMAVLNNGALDENFAVMIDRNNMIEWIYQSGSLYARYVKSGTAVTVATLTYTATSHLYWRVRESGGTVYWDTSADGVVWAIQASTPTANVMLLSAVRAELYAESYAAGSATPGIAKFSSLQ